MEECPKSESDVECIGYSICKCGQPQCPDCGADDGSSAVIADVKDGEAGKDGDGGKDAAEDSDSSAEARKAPISSAKKGAQFTRSEDAQMKRKEGIQKPQLKLKRRCVQPSDGEKPSSSKGGGGGCDETEVKDKKADDVLRAPFTKEARNGSANRVAESYLLQAPGPTKRYNRNVP